MGTPREFRQVIKSDELYERITSTVASQFNGSKLDFLISAIDCLVSQSVNGEIDLSDDEKIEVEEAINASGLSYGQLLKVGLLAECRRIKKQSETLQNMQNLSLAELIERGKKGKDTEGKKGNTIRGFAALKIQKTVEALMEYNNHCQDKADKTYISQSIVAEITRSNRKAIIEYFEANKGEIDEHNADHKLDKRHNAGKDKDRSDYLADLGLQF